MALILPPYHLSQLSVLYFSVFFLLAAFFFLFDNVSFFFMYVCFKMQLASLDLGSKTRSIEKFSKIAKNEVKGIKLAILATPRGVSAALHGMLAAEDTPGNSRGA